MQNRVETIRDCKSMQGYFIDIDFNWAKISTAIELSFVANVLCGLWI